VADIVAQHAVDKDLTRGRLLLSVLMLEVWLSSFLPRALAAPHAAPVRAPAA
jgi:hypothetical protein